MQGTCQEGIWQLYIHSISDVKGPFCSLTKLTSVGAKSHLGRNATESAVLEEEWGYLANSHQRYI